MAKRNWKQCRSCRTKITVRNPENVCIPCSRKRIK